ncbi:MAG: T9SS type A sorting domain-containing protein, partial [Bacteroidota bacterium]
PTIDVTGSADFDAVFEIFDGCGGTSLYCVDNSFAGETEIITTGGLSIGNTYFVRVYDWYSSMPATTTFDICVYDTPAPPVNDDCSNAITVTCGTTTSGTTLYSTIDTAVAADCGPATVTGPGVWYSIAGTGDSITVSTCDSAAYDTKIGIYDGSCGSLNCVAGNDDGTGCSGYTSEVSFVSVSGTTYYILVHGYETASGDFNLTITCAAACALSTTTMSTDMSCYGVCDGNAAVTVTGGSAPYTYLWNDPGSQTTSTATGLCGGTFTVLVTDANGCLDSANTQITEPPALSVNISHTDATCGISDGSATANVSGGTVPYTYSWNNGDSTQQITGLTSGNYYVDITDNNGCIISDSVTISCTDDINEISQISNYKIYPNPTRGTLNLEFVLGITKDINIIVTDMIGEIVSSEELKDVSSQLHSIDLSERANGVYYIHIMTDDEVIVEKVSVVR